MNVLITGAGGRVGRLIPGRFVRDGHAVRVLDRQPVDGVADALVGDIADFDTVRRAVDGMDAVVHLAGIPGNRPMAELAGPNILGVEHVLRASQQAGVRRVAFASTAQLVTTNDSDTPIRPTDPLRPMTPYACTKAFAEALGRHYFDRYGLAFVAIRLGCCFPFEASKFAEIPARRACWISPRDAAQAFFLAATAPGVGFEALFATSKVPHPKFDLTPIRQTLGYEPLDDLAAAEAAGR